MKDQIKYQKQAETILNDNHRKELFKALFDLYVNAIPLVSLKENKVICSYSDKVEELANKIREQITLRDNQIFNSIK